MSTSEHVVVLGIDPGTAVTGYGVVTRSRGGAVALFLAVGLCACYGPVYRATRIRATEALKYE